MLKQCKVYLSLLLAVAMVFSGLVFLPASAAAQTTATSFAALDMSAYGLTEILIRLDSPFVETVMDAHAQDVSTEKSGNPSEELQNTAKNHLLINGKSISEMLNEGAGWWTARVHVTQYGSNEQFDLYIYDSIFGRHIYDEDFTVEITEGAVDSQGNPIKPVKMQYSATTHSFTEYVAPKTNITNVAIADFPDHGMSQLYVYLDSKFTKDFGDIQSPENATGEPSEALLNAVANNIIINDKSIATYVSENQWWNGVRVYLSAYGEVEMLTFYLYDAAFGGKMYDKDFTFEFTDGMIDGSGNLIAPAKYTHKAADHSFEKYIAPPTSITGFAITDMSAYNLTELQIITDAIHTTDYVDFNAAGKNPPAHLLATHEAYILLNGKSIGDIRAAGGTIWGSLLAYGEYQQFVLHVYNGTIGENMYNTNFTIEILEGATDADGNAIAPCKYQYNAATHEFSVYKYVDVNITDFAIMDQSDYDMTELAILTDGTADVNFAELQSKANATGSPSDALLESVATKILINDKSISELMTGLDWYNAVRVYLVNNDSGELFDIYLYDAAFGGKHLYEEDFTIEFLEGAIDGAGNPIVPCKYQYTAEDQSFSVYVPKTNVIGITATPNDTYGLTEFWIALDAKYDKDYYNITAGETGAIQAFYDTACNYILFNGQTVTEATGVYVHMYGRYDGVQQFNIMYYDREEGVHLTEKDFTVEFVEGATDSWGNPIVPVKYQWSAKTQSFSVVTGDEGDEEITYANISGVSAQANPTYGMTQVWIKLDAKGDGTYYSNIGAGESGASQALYDTARNYILFNGKSVANADTNTYVFLETAWDGYQQFDIRVYDKDGVSFAANDFTLEIVDGATDSMGNRIAPMKYHYSAANGTFGVFDANTLTLVRKQLIEGKKNITLDFNDDGEFDIRDLVNLKKKVVKGEI